MQTSAEFLAQVLDFYARTKVDPSKITRGNNFGKRNDAHYPTPAALGGTKTIPLLWDAHSILDLLLSVELDAPYFWPGHVHRVLRNLPDDLDAELHDFLWYSYRRLTSQGLPGQRTKAGIAGGTKTLEMGVGIHGLTSEQHSANGRLGGHKGGTRTVEMGYGFGGSQRTDSPSEVGQRGGEVSVSLGSGIHGLTFEQRSENGKAAVEKQRSNGQGRFNSESQRKLGLKGGAANVVKRQAEGTPMFIMSTEQLSEAGQRGGAAAAAQRWQSLLTGMVASAANVARHHRARGLPDWRIRLENS